MFDAVFGKEHVLGAAESDTLGAEQASLLGVARNVGVGADLEPANRVDPAHEPDQIRIVGLGGQRLELARDDAAGGAVERDPVSLMEDPAFDAQFLARLVDEAIARAGDAALAHAARDDGRMRGHAAARGENARRDFHARDVLRRGFAAHQNDGAIGAVGVELDRILGREDDLADGRAGRSRKPGGQHLDLLALFDETRHQEVIELVGFDAEDRFFLRDEPLAHHVDGDAHGGQAGAFAVARLQHVELAILNGELEVLHVAIVFFHLARDVAQMLVDLGHGALKLADGQRRAHARDHVFALRVHQILAEEDMLAGGRIAREADAGAGVFAEIAEDHGLHVDRGAEPVVDVIDAAIGLGAIIVPTAENGIARLHKLVKRALRKVLARLLAHQLLVLDDDLFERVGNEFVVELHPLARLGRVEDRFEFFLRNLEHHVAEHLDQAAIGVVGKARIIAAPGKCFHSLIVQAEVQNRVHHARHRKLCAGTDRDQQRIFSGAELLPLHVLKVFERRMHLDVDLRTHGAAHVLATSLGLNGEAGRDRQPRVGHFGEPRALAAQHVFHAPIAVGLATAEEVDVLGCG